MNRYKKRPNSAGLLFSLPGCSISSGSASITFITASIRKKPKFTGYECLLAGISCAIRRKWAKRRSSGFWCRRLYAREGDRFGRWLREVGVAHIKQPGVRGKRGEIVWICAARPRFPVSAGAAFAANRTGDRLRSPFILPILRRHTRQ